jgi:hypothetical protein
MSNIRVRSKLEWYPCDGEGSSSEFWHGEKLAGGKNLSQLTPMETAGSIQYYVNEICELVDTSLFIPDMFFHRRGELWARGHRLLALENVSFAFRACLLFYSLTALPTMNISPTQTSIEWHKITQAIC